MGTAESSQTTRRHWGHRELERHHLEPRSHRCVRKSCTRDLSLHVGEGCGPGYLGSFWTSFRLAIGTSHP